MARKVLPAFATVKELSDRVGEPITDPEDVAMAASMLNIVSSQIRAYGSDWPLPLLAPDAIWGICLTAAARGYNNPAAYNLERSDQFHLQRTDASSEGEMLTREEIAKVKRLAAYSGFWQVPIQRDVLPSDRYVVLTGEE